MRILVISTYDTIVFKGDAADFFLWVLDNGSSDYVYLVRTVDTCTVHNFSEIVAFIAALVRKVSKE